LERWRSELRHFLPGVPAIVVGCKADARESAEEEENNAREEKSKENADNASGEDESDMESQRLVTTAQGKLMVTMITVLTYLLVPYSILK